MSDAASSRELLCSGVFELDFRREELRRQGLRIRLQEQPFQVLAMLLDHPDELLTREELRLLVGILERTQHGYTIDGYESQPTG